MGLLARLRNMSRQASSLLCTSVVIWTCLPAALLGACCTSVNTPLDPETDGAILCSIPSSLYHLCREAVRAFLGMAVRAADNFSCCLGGRRSR